MKKLTVFIFITINVCNSLILPPNFKKCNASNCNFDQCLSKTVHRAIQQLYRPLEEYDLPSLAILNMPKAEVEFGNSTDSLHQKFTNFTFYGLSQPERTSAKRSVIEERTLLYINVTYVELGAEFDYEARGRIVILPVDVVTSCYIILYKPVFKLTFELEPYEKESEIYFRVFNTNLVIDPEDATIKYRKLFDNENLNNEFNAELTRKSKEIVVMLKHYQQIFAPSFGQIFDSLLEKVPRDELIDGY